METTTIGEPVVGVYSGHADAEAAVRRLVQAGIPVAQISIVGRDFELREDIQGFYRPADAAAEGAAQGAWFGGLFGLMVGAFGFFVFPFIGPLFIFGPLAGLVAGIVAGAGVGALINALIAAGVPRDQALKYENHLKAGKFLVLVHGTPDQIELARNALGGAAEAPAQVASGIAAAPS